MQSHFTPIVTIVDKDNKDLGLKAYEHGAMDVIYKPLDRSELLVRIWNRLMYKQYINNAVLLDELTGTFNRKFLNLELERYLFEMKRTKQSFSLALLDIDHFKNVNDQYGHQMGDVVLKEFAAFILKKKRHSDYCIRFGGEEFLLLLPHTKASEAATFLDRLRSDFQDFSFSSEDRGKFTVTFSAGIVEIKDTLLTSDEHMKRADHALYEAKQAGRNQVRVYGEEKPITANSKVIRVGIIDDDTIVHEMLEERLSKLNFENHVIDLKSFREGESFFTSEWHKQNGKYLIILDGMMPRMDGLEVLQRLREKYDEKKFIVLMLTGRKSENDIVRALELGADDYLTKPFNFAELEARVKRLIARMMI
ncbi:MAG: diguanylate cyclase [Bacillaceae bacterium]|nr:diguanylate cyclase [Bacillaceae bacterium]